MDSPRRGPILIAMPFKNPRGLVEAQIAAARERGEFDHLPGEGKPLDLDDMTGLSSEERFEAMLLKTLGEVREEVALLREIKADRQSLERAQDPVVRERLQRQIQDKAQHVSRLFEARRKSLAESKRKREP